jgi:hypothetical protein
LGLGYIAHKFRFKFPELGEKTSSLNDAKKLDCPWIAALSRGGLHAPSAEFTSQAFQIEKYFNLIHGQTFKDGSSIIKGTADQVVRIVTSLPEEVVRAFIKTRTFIRIKFLNHQLRFNDHSAKNRNQNKIQHFKK